jgi:opacity protein-like surface antigen
MKLQRILCILALAALAAPASAEPYLGAGLGRSHFNDFCSASVCDTRDTAFNFFAGYRFARFIALEGAYDALGHARVLDTETKADAWSGSGVLTIPLNRRFAVFGKLGAYHGNMKAPGISQRKNGATVAGGIEYDFDPRFGLRGQWQRFRKMGGGEVGTSTDIDVATLQALFRF